jgi:phosphoribosylformylglycinamidine (FGAM) synthase PurS component
MYIGKETVNTVYTRLSKLGNTHKYVRTKTVAVFRCDNCDEIFRRDLKKISQKRLSNNYFHVCSDCDVKRFAQRKGVERKKIWDMPASIELPVGKY